MCPKSRSVCPLQAFPTQCNVTIYLIRLFVSYVENEVLWIRHLIRELALSLLTKNLLFDRHFIEKIYFDQSAVEEMTAPCMWRPNIIFTKCLVCRPNVFKPNVFQPNVFQPNVFQPNVFQPNVFQPNVFQPNVFQPNVFQPHVFQPNVFQPNVFQQNVFQPNVFKPNAFKPNACWQNTWRLNPSWQKLIDKMPIVKMHVSIMPVG